MDLRRIIQRGSIVFPILETKRLILREITKADADAIFECFSNEQIMKYYGSEPFQNIEQALDLIELFSKNYLEKKTIRWGIELKESKEFIGTVGYHAWAPKHRKAEIGYEIHPDFWRKGYASEAIKKIAEYGFNEMNLTRIGAIIYLENHASYKLLEKLGFLREGVLRKNMYQNGAPHDTYVYSLTK